MLIKEEQNMEATNNLNQGMNSDIAKTILNKDTYLQAINFRAMTELGSSNGSLVNIKGNECGIQFPYLRSVFKIKIIKGLSTITNSQSITISINGISTLSFNINNNTRGIDLYNILVKLTNAYENPIVGVKDFSIAYDADYITISQQPIYEGCSPIISIEPVINITQSTNLNLTTLQFSSTIADTFTQTPKITGSNNLIIIGSTFIQDDIYLLTAVNDSSYTENSTFNDSFTKPGHIWKLSINDITKQHTLKLLYSNNLDFTKYHPVPPSAITGRYESRNIQRIYWSDNFNKIRTINVASEQLMALDPTILSVQPSIDYSQAILNAIIGGSLVSGCYQLAYRLTKTLGSITNVSELSNPIYITPSPENSAFEKYEGAAGGTSKGIQWKVDNLDLSFDNIEWIVAYKNTESSVPFIQSIKIEPINTSGSMMVDFTANSGSAYATITLEEFLLFTGTFTHAKTVDTKDNRLFWGNVRAPRKNLESFDARAFRANDLGNILLKNSNAIFSYPNKNAAAVLDQTEDTINEYYTTSGDYSPNACYLKPSTATTTKILGGEGLNISYEFGTEVYQVDNRLAPNFSTPEGWDLFNNHVGSPYRTNDGISGNKVLKYTYPQNNKFQALKQPERTSLLRGFQHEEIYRFGIQFFDKEGNPYFTKWIGDIKMPSYGDFNNNPGGAVPDFRLTYKEGSNSLIGQTLYIKFTIDLYSVQDIIGGYEIVRVKREGTNRTIWGVGMVNPMMSIDGDDFGATAVLPAGWKPRLTTFNAPPPFLGEVLPYYSPYPSQESVETLNINNDDPSTINFARFKTFDCFDFDLGLRPSFADGDRLLIRSRLESVNYRSNVGGYRQYFHKSLAQGGGSVPGNTTNIDDGEGTPFLSKSNNDNTFQPFFIMKMFNELSYCTYNNFITSNSNPFDYAIEESQYVLGNDVANYAGYSINNNGKNTSGSSITCGGKQTLFLSILNNRDNSANRLYTSDAPYSCRADSPSSFYKLLALYYKPNSNLYGGATYSDRASNEYIGCGEFIPIALHSNTTPLEVLGGDVFTTVQDMQKTFQRFAAGPTYRTYEYLGPGGAYSGFGYAQAKYSTSFFFGTTGIKNSEMRFGNHINKSLDFAVVGDAGYEEDDYNYETYNNSENDIKTYFPKPLDFQTADEWINRVYFSEIKINNEPIDSWSNYLTNSFYDVEGNYGGINCLISLRDNMYYIQERAVGLLMINPVSMINDQTGTPIKLGEGSKVIQKHYNKAIDVGTSHQWSVYRSQSTISFVDVRHKKIYMFNGENVLPISDTKGQRNFIIKRLHNELLEYDNPVIDKGVLTTYDYYHNEFLYTFNNTKILIEDPLTYDSVNDENLTLVFSESTGNFTSMYNFTPNIYINSNKYLLSTNRSSRIWFHNYGDYGSFYGVVYPSLLKILINDGPKFTKVFDNVVLTTESIDDQVEWNDDLNVYPGSVTTPSYPDDVNKKNNTFSLMRCYNQYQNTDWVNLTTDVTIRKVEQEFNIQLPRNKFNYDTNPASTFSIFDPSKLTKVRFGERLRDKWLIVDLKYLNNLNLRFIVHNIRSLFKVSDR